MAWKTAARFLALVSLTATIAPAAWFCFSAGGEAQAKTVKVLMLVSMLLWFVSATAWLWPGRGVVGPAEQEPPG